MTGELAAEMQDIKASLNSMSKDIGKLLQQQKKLSDLMVEIEQRKVIIKQKNERIEFLVLRVNDLDQYSSACDLAITGIQLPVKLCPGGWATWRPERLGGPGTI